jgi:hypothetical protein
MRPKAVTSEDLLATLRKGQRTGTWRKMHLLDKALVKASLHYLRHGGRISNESLLVKLERVIEQLQETRGNRILKRRLTKAVDILNRLDEESLFISTSGLKQGLKIQEIFENP